jgi:hypothetical protein
MADDLLAALHTLRAAGARHVRVRRASGVAVPRDREAALARLLHTFASPEAGRSATAEEVRRFVRGLPRGEGVHAALPAHEAALTLAHFAADVLAERGATDRALFDHLADETKRELPAAERLRRKHEVEVVRARFDPDRAEDRSTLRGNRARSPVLAFRKRGASWEIEVAAPAVLGFEGRVGFTDVTQGSNGLSARWEPFARGLDGALLELEAALLGASRRAEAELPEAGSLPETLVRELLAQWDGEHGAEVGLPRQGDLEHAWGIDRGVWDTAAERGALVRFVRRNAPRVGISGLFEEAAAELLHVRLRLLIHTRPERRVPVPEPTRLTRAWPRVANGFVLGCEIGVESWDAVLLFPDAEAATYEALVASVPFFTRLADLAQRLLPLHVEAGDARAMRDGALWQVRRADHCGRLGVGRIGVTASLAAAGPPPRAGSS